MKRLWNLYCEWIDSLPWPVTFALFALGILVLVSVVRWVL